MADIKLIEGMLPGGSDLIKRNTGEVLLSAHGSEAPKPTPSDPTPGSMLEILRPRGDE